MPEPEFITEQVPLGLVPAPEQLQLQVPPKPRPPPPPNLATVTVPLGWVTNLLPDFALTVPPTSSTPSILEIALVLVRLDHVARFINQPCEAGSIVGTGRRSTSQQGYP
jgi:hypothetical protein